MANASCATVTVNNTAMVVSGSVSGTILVGATLTGAGIPPAVIVVSQQTGTAGQAGNYTVTASAAAVTVPEPVVFSLAGIMPYISNAIMPQLVDLALAAGFSAIFLTVIPSPTAAIGQEYNHGTHQDAIYNQQAGARLFPPVKGIQGRSVVPTILTQGQYPEPVPSSTFRPPNLSIVAKQIVRQFVSAPQQFDLTQQALLSRPQTPQSSTFFFTYQSGNDQKVIYDTNAGGIIFGVGRSPQTGPCPLKTIIVNPQELSRDLTIQGWTNIVPVPSGWLLTMITAGPQLADLSLQAQISKGRPFTSLAPPAPLNPKTVISVSQADPTQIASVLFSPPPRPAANLSPRWFFAYQDDPTQIQPQIFQRKIAGGQRYVQPDVVYAGEQVYSNDERPSITFRPLTLFVPPPPTPYVQPAFVSTREQFYLNVPYSPTFKQIIFSSVPIPPSPGSGKPGGRVILDPKKLSESPVYTADFISSMLPNETILTGVVVASVFSGTDPNPTAIISGIAGASGTRLSQRITGGVLGVIYELLYIITTSLGNTIEISAYLAIIPDLV